MTEPVPEARARLRRGSGAGRVDGQARFCDRIGTARACRGNADSLAPETA